MTKLLVSLFISFLLCFSCTRPQFEKVVLSEEDPSDLYINDSGSTQLFYLKLVPPSTPIGAVVIFPSGGETVEDLIQQIEIPEMAFDNNVVTIIPSINWGTESRNVEIDLLNQIFEEVVQQHNVPKDNFVLGGLSNGGVIALTYAAISAKERERTFIQPAGVFGLDVPLDKAHLYAYCQREIERNFSEAGVNEARWLLNNFNQIYGGSPAAFPERYVETSVYSHGAENGGNAQYLIDMPIRMYTDLDVEWMMYERQRDLYDWNGTDIVAMINQLKMMGNPDANVIITIGKGIRLDGSRHPHSWSIMGNEDCMDWMFKLFGEK